jgi:hypothetical protein
MPFKKFENTHARFEERITLTKSYSLGFPTRFYEDNGIKKFKSVVLFYDEEKKEIGIQFSNDEEEKNAFSIVHSEKYGGTVPIRSFIRFHKIDPEIYYGRYDWEKRAEEGIGELYIIKLKPNEKAKVPKSVSQ